ncbi:MAG: hypothetical protein JWM29_1673, partial [Solirubrobacterales bacterium]|nr:hypothetical protein [Solirubrobacterales bacterium]
PVVPVKAPVVPTPTLPSVPSKLGPVTVPTPTAPTRSGAGSSATGPSGSASRRAPGIAGGGSSVLGLFAGSPGPGVGSSSVTGLNRGLAALEEAISRPGAGEQAPIRRQALRAAVRAFQACLGNLPERLRLALELATGIDVPSALSPAAVAEALHVTARELPRLQRQGLKRLLIEARAHTCVAAGAAAQPSDLLMLSTLAPPMGGEGGPIGGVEAARYAQSPSPLPEGVQAGHSPSGSAVLGISAPAAAGGALLLIALILAGLLAVGLLSADGIAPWELRRKWRSRWIHHHPWNWHG